MHLRLVTSGLVLSGLALCGAGLVASTALADTTANFRCDDGAVFVATFSPPAVPGGSVELVFADGRKATLPQAPSADGGRYVKGDIEFWIKGNGGTLTQGAKSTQCQALE